MKILNHLWALIFLAGCNNAVYFYETEKASLTLEARPDPSAPISGSIGIKQRIAAVVPAAATRPSKDAGDVASGDALSVMSLFRFHKYPASIGAIVPRVTIEAALVTGNAARLAAADGEVNEVMLSLTSDDEGSAEMLLAAVAHVYEGLAEEAAAQPGSAAAQRKAAMDAIAADLPATYPVDTYLNAADAAHHVHRLQVRAGGRKGDAVPRGNFLDVIAYESALNETAISLTQASKFLSGAGVEQQTLPGAAAPVATGEAALVSQGLSQQAANVAKLLEEHRRHFENDPAVKAGIKAFFGMPAGRKHG